MLHCSNPVHFVKGEPSRYKFSTPDFSHPYDNERIIVDVMDLQSDESLLTYSSFQECSPRALDLVLSNNTVFRCLTPILE